MIDLIKFFLREKDIDLSIIDKLGEVWVPKVCNDMG